MKRNPVGRPPVASKNELSAQLACFLTQDEAGLVRALASEDKISVSAWIRRAITLELVKLNGPEE